MSGFLSGALSELKGAMGENGVDSGAGGNLLQSAFESAGGVQGIIGKAQQAGLGDKVESWIGSGSNIPLMAGEVEKIFPPAEIESFAAQHGVPAGIATQLLAHLVPQAVDQQTSGGSADAYAAGQGAGTTGASGGGGFDFAGLASKFLGGI